MITAKVVRQHMVGETADQLAGVGGTETDGVVERILQGVALVREVGRNIENIAGAQLHIDNGLEGIDLEQIRMRAVLTALPFLPDTPASAAATLDDEDIILVDVWADATAGNREGDHQIVHPPVRQVAERSHQRRRRGMPVIDRLYQQRPVGLAQVVIAGKRTMAHLPRPLLVTDQAAVHLLLHRQPGQFVR
ncbi:Uncharacterised protein [Edwardsiella tarda]|nr:Uncharacterised protein [Edwardsiella tarda]